MDPRDRRHESNDAVDGPTIETQDWQDIEGAKPESVSENGDIRYDVEKEGEVPEEDDDNAYQNSDEALPDDAEERVISRDPSKEGSRFDEV